MSKINDSSKSKFYMKTLCFTVIVSVLLTAVLSNTTALDENGDFMEGTDYKNENTDGGLFEISTTADESALYSSKTTVTGIGTECKWEFTENGTFYLPENGTFHQECQEYRINLDFKRENSIVKLTMLTKHSRDRTNLSGGENSSVGNFTVLIYEPTQPNTEKILLAKWEINLLDEVKNRSYLSRSSKLFILVSGNGNWSHYEIAFSFSEIENRLIPIKISTASGKKEIQYHPNTVTLCRFENPNEKKKGIEIKFENLNINKEMGEYLLIGAGTDVFKRKDFLPLYVTEVTEYSTFYVGELSAHVAFISRSTDKNDRGFSILWNRTDAFSVPVPEEDPLGELNSSLICFYSYSAAIKEYENNASENFEAFRQHFAAFITEESSEFQKKRFVSLDEKSIVLFGQPTEKKANDNHTKSLALLIKIIYNGKSIFTWRELQYFIERFEKNENNNFEGYQAHKCPTDNRELPYKDKWSFIIYAMVPAFALLALMIWAWRQNIFSQKCTPEKKQSLSLCSPPPVTARPNTYERTIPKVYLTDMDSRRMTLVQGSTQQDDESSEETSIEINPIPPTSQEPDVLTRFLASQNNKPRPSIHNLLEKNEEISELTPMSKPEGNESEHLYNLVNSHKEMTETKL